MNVATNPLPQCTCSNDSRLNELIKLLEICQAIVMNMVFQFSVPYKAMDSPAKVGETRERPLMLFATPTLLNHSCKSRAFLKYWGDANISSAFFLSHTDTRHTGRSRSCSLRLAQKL